jgi:DNA repair protein SbcD/Mre11
VRFLLFSDLHLDTQFAWLGGRPKVAGQRRQALRDTLVRIADLALRERVDALMCGGDLYEQDRFTPDTAAFVRSVFARLNPLPVFLAPGNHDWLGPASLYAQVEWSQNVKVFRENRLTPVTLLDGLTLWGAAHQAPANTNGFLDEFRVDRGGIHIALFHGSEQGALAFQEQGKVPHAPFRLTQIAESGLHHALLGHFHRSRATEYFTYPGNPDPLTFGEEGERGAVIVTVDERGRTTQEWRHVASSTLHAIGIDVSACGNQQDIRTMIQKATRGLTGCAQITLHGELDPTIELRVAQLGGAVSDDLEVLVRVGKLHHAYDIEAISREPTVRGEFVRDVMASPDMDPDARQLVLITGLRALDGRSDLDATA